jgi:serine/threonine-protein kinase
MNHIILRNRPLCIENKNAGKAFNLSSRYNPLKYMPNKYEENGLTIIDHLYGLQWQKSGSDLCPLNKINLYIQELNTLRFEGHNNWRLPTTVELISLLEPEKQASGLYISSLFDAKQEKCWGSDHFRGYLWNVYFNRKRVFFDNSVSHYVRAVRQFKNTDTP